MKTVVKNITFVSSYFAPAWSYGGPPKVLFTLAKELVRMDKKVRVITSDALDKRRNKILQEIIEGVKVYRFRTFSNYLSYKGKFFFVPSLLRKTKRILDKSDLVLFSGIRPLVNWQLYQYVVKKKIPYGIFAFGQIPRGVGIKSIAKTIFDYLWVRDFVKKASFRFCQTHHEQEMFKQFFDISLSETQLLSLPVERREYKNNINLLNAFKKRWGIEKSDRILLFVGRLHYLKGVDVLIRAIIPLLKKDKQLKLLIVGRDDGEEKNLLKIIPPVLKRQIIFTGPLYGKEVLIAYNISTCFVFTPRHYEETSLACLEALSFGVPVITTYEADIPHLEEYRAGLVVRNESSVIRRSIVEMLKKAGENQEDIKKGAKRLINDHFLSKSIAGQLLNFIKEKSFK